MQTRPTPIGRELFDAIIKSNTKENEEIAIRLLCTVASQDVHTKNQDAVTIAHLNSALLDDKCDNMTVLMTAVKAGNERIVKIIIDLITFYHEKILKVRFKLDALDVNGNTALMHAASAGNLNLVKLLVATNACDPTCKNALWQNALSLASAGQHHEVAAYLTELYKEIDVKKTAALVAAAKKMETSVGDVKNHIDVKEPEFKKPHTPNRK